MGHQVDRAMARCLVCRRWWSYGDGMEDKMCACGGDLELVDMAAHVASLPYFPMKPETPPEKK